MHHRDARGGRDDEVHVNETQLIWKACGSPAPFGCEGEPIPKAKRIGITCARCGASDPAYSVDELISSNFVPTRNKNRISGFGGSSYCAACVFCARALRLRCISWFASDSGMQYWRTRPEVPGGPRPDALATLLNPPEPPFVCGIPLYGISHGGENNWQRAWWPGAANDDVLVRLQSKHVALYSRLALSRDRYPVQVDDSTDFILDRDLWLRLRDAANVTMRAIIDEGVPPYPAKKSLVDLVIPHSTGAPFAARWQQLTASLRPYIQTIWWDLFCEFIPTLEAKEGNAKTRKRTDTRSVSAKSKDSAAPAGVPAASNQTPDELRGARARQVQLNLW